MMDALLYFSVDAESQIEGSSARMLRDQKILLGTTYDLMATAADRSPSALETLGEDKVQKILQLSMASSVTQVMSYLDIAFWHILLIVITDYSCYSRMGHVPNKMIYMYYWHLSCKF